MLGWRSKGRGDKQRRGDTERAKGGEKREKERRCKLWEAGRVCKGREDAAGLVGT